MKKNKKEKALKKIKIISAVLVLAIISSAALYVFQTNLEISERYLIQEYAKKSEDLRKENKNLQISSAKVSSLAKITELANPLGFEKTEKIHYIRAIGAHVVAK